MMRRMALSGAAAILVLLALRFAAAQANDGSNTLVLSVPSNQWFEGPGVQVSISSDGKWALLTHGPTMSLFSLETHRQEPDVLLGGLTSLSRARFCGPNAFVRLGQRGSELGIFLPGSVAPQLATIPPGSVVNCSADGGEIVYYIPENPDRQMFVGPVHGPFKTFEVTGRITGTAFRPTAPRCTSCSSRPRAKRRLSVSPSKSYARKRLRTIWMRLPMGTRLRYRPMDAAH